MSQNVSFRPLTAKSLSQVTTSGQYIQVI